MPSKRRAKDRPKRVSSPLRPVSTPSANLVTLLTDFGTADYFLGALKGVILSANPETLIVDLTHEIPPQDIEAAAFNLLAAYKSFPAGTIHVAVVDPGVGSARRGICVIAANQYFVGPDNGIFSYIYEREADFRIFEITNDKYFHHPVSNSFHGRDIFAPVAAAISSGLQPEQFGRRISDPVKLEPLAPQVLSKGKEAFEIHARIIHIDRFGNCITNITNNELTSDLMLDGPTLWINRRSISAFRDFFSDQPGGNKKASATKRKKTPELFCIWGSAGFLEIAIANGSAAALLRAKRGQAAIVKIGSDYA